METIFILYSCKKNLEKTNKTYDKIYDKINNTKVYIIYGDELNEKYKIIDDKYLVLNVNDDYDHLCDKTLLLFQTISHLFPSIKGIFKCDDDVIINLLYINTILKIIETKNIDYCGKSIVLTKEYDTKFPTEHPTEECTYCGGPLYYLSKKAVDYFNTEVKNIYYEDIMVGYHLNKFNIYPDEKYYLYSDDINHSNVAPYHNSTHTEELYIYIQGGLGNQLFQIACAMKMAEKNNKKFILNSLIVIPSPHQYNDKSIVLNTIKVLFPDITISDKKLDKLQFRIYLEEKNDCFLFKEEKIEDCFDVYNNIVLRGYFINYKYIPLHIFEKIKITPTDQRLLNFDFTNVYFIHIRLGDYLKNKMYKINLKRYYNYCINQILRLNADAKFIICTNQHDDN